MKTFAPRRLVSAALINLVTHQPVEVTPDQLPKVPLPVLVTFQRSSITPWLFIKTHHTASDYEGSDNRGIRSDYDYGRVHEERSEANIYLRSAMKISAQMRTQIWRKDIISLLQNIQAMRCSSECQRKKGAGHEIKIYPSFRFISFDDGSFTI